MDLENFLIFIVAPAAGLMLALRWSSAKVLSGKMALGFSLLPFIGFFLAWAFC
jgi:hypothetical protein